MSKPLFKLPHEVFAELEAVRAERDVLLDLALSVASLPIVAFPYDDDLVLVQRMNAMVEAARSEVAKREVLLGTQGREQ